jgi:hypothetical protein
METFRAERHAEIQAAVREFTDAIADLRSEIVSGLGDKDIAAAIVANRKLIETIGADVATANADHARIRQEAREELARAVTEHAEIRKDFLAEMSRIQNDFIRAMANSRPVSGSEDLP